MKTYEVAEVQLHALLTMTLKISTQPYVSAALCLRFQWMWTTLKFLQEKKSLHLYSFFSVILWRLNFMFRRFETLCLPSS